MVAMDFHQPITKSLVMITTLGDWLKNISLHFRKIKSIGDFFAQVFQRASRVFASHSGLTHFTCIDLIPKWPSFKYSFVFIQISP